VIKLVPDLFFDEKNAKQALCDFIKSTDRLSIGPQCEQFETLFAKWQERDHCTLFNSGSSANLALIQALINLKRIQSKEVAAFSAVTWATNVMPLMQLGLTPLPVDIEIDTLNISSRTLTLALDKHPQVKLLFLTHLLGFCGDLDNIRRICDERGITLIEDVCESLGSEFQGAKLGNFGLASTFSFFVGHHLSMIEGGAVCTNDPELNRMLKLVRAHGWDRNLADQDKENIRRDHQITDDFFANFTFYELGFNLRPTEITGFLGIQQLPHADKIVAKRHQNFNQFQQVVNKNPDLLPLKVDHLDIVSNFSMPIVCRSQAIAARYIKDFTQADVEIRPIVGGSIPEQPFFKKQIHLKMPTPNAAFVNHHGFYFGNHPKLSDTDLSILENLLQPIQVKAGTAK